MPEVIQLISKKLGFGLMVLAPEYQLKPLCHTVCWGLHTQPKSTWTSDCQKLYHKGIPNVYLLQYSVPDTSRGRWKAWPNFPKSVMKTKIAPLFKPSNRLGLGEKEGDKS